jgi:hypothetical protein
MPTAAVPALNKRWRHHGRKDEWRREILAPLGVVAVGRPRTAGAATSIDDRLVREHPELAPEGVG